MTEDQRLLIQGRTYSVSDGGLQSALERIYESPERPRCLCVAGGLEMYVARLHRLVVKRMPGTGTQHHPSCSSYEPPAALSGLAALLGDAVVEHSPVSVELYLDFPLSRVRGRAIPRGESDLASDVSAPRHRLGLRALIHLLWERAGFHRWSPAMTGKRSWAVIRHYLLDAAAELRTRGEPLREHLFLPETFNEQRRSEIAQRRQQQLASLHVADDTQQVPMAILIGEFKAVEPSTFGRRIWIKHLPDCPLLIEEKVWARAERAFEPMFEACAADASHGLRLVIGALMHARREFTYQVDRLTFMLVTREWIPVEGLDEVLLVEALTRQSRRFLKPLRYDLKATAGLPSALLLDTGPAPTALHVISGLQSPDLRAAQERAIKEGGADPWLWHTQDPMPGFPAAAGLSTAPSGMRRERPAAAGPCGRSGAIGTAGLVRDPQEAIPGT